jgi:predicted permease
MLAVSGDPAWLELRFGWQAMLFTATVGVATALLFGLAPAVRASSVSPDAVLKGSGGRVTGRLGLLRPLLAVQVAFSFVVLFGAGLLLTSFHKLTKVDLGFTRSGVVLFSLAGNARASQFDLLDQIRGLPLVESAGLSGWPVFSRNSWAQPVAVPGKPRDPEAAYHLDVSPGFLETMRIGLVEGRGFHPGDMGKDSSQVVVNQAFARRYFPGESPVGRRYDRLTASGQIPQTIIGVVRDARYNDVRKPAPATVYVPLQGLRGVSLAVRTKADPRLITAAVQDRLRQVDPALRIAEVTLQSTLVEDKLVRERLLALLSGFFALVAATLAAVGLYGVLNYSVLRRTREIGIRVAMGARPRTVVRLVVSEIALFTAAGLGTGMAAGLALARWVVALLYEVKPTDAGSLGLPFAALLAICALAAALPALRASRVDPVVALRYE